MTGIEQQLEQLRAALIEIDAKIAAVPEHATD
jgi:hypothetical protein